MVPTSRVLTSTAGSVASSEIPVLILRAIAATASESVRQLQLQPQVSPTHKSNGSVGGAAMHSGGTIAPPNHLHPSPRDVGCLSPSRCSSQGHGKLHFVTHVRLAHTHPANLRCFDAVHALPPHPPPFGRQGYLNHIHSNHRPCCGVALFATGVASVLDVVSLGAPHRFVTRVNLGGSRKFGGRKDYV